MRKIITILAALIFFLTGMTVAAEEIYNISISVTPFVSKAIGEREPNRQEIKLASGESVVIDLGVFQTEMTIAEYGQKMVFTFDHDLELCSGSLTAETQKVIAEEYTAMHLRTPTMDSGAWLDISWGHDNIPLIYQDFIKSISSIYAGDESERYGINEDYSIMFEVQSARPQ